jgi:hypothetical protein
MRCPGVSITRDLVRSEQLRLILPIVFGRKDRCSQSGIVETDAPAMDQKLINALKRAHSMIRRDDTGLPVIERRPKGPQARQCLTGLAGFVPTHGRAFQVQKSIYNAEDGDGSQRDLGVGDCNCHDALPLTYRSRGFDAHVYTAFMKRELCNDIQTKCRECPV